MLQSLFCPICECNKWEVIGQKKYDNDKKELDEYQQIRNEILFEVWFPKEQEVLLTIVACCKCGFVCYKPRPDNEDIKRKYNYISLHNVAGKEFSTDLPSDKKRSKELYRFVKPYLNKDKNTILDFGGGKGRLLYEFLKFGHHCSIVDLDDKILPGVYYIGDRLSNIPETKRFDLIICSHVMEHIADPLTTLMKLKDFIDINGKIFIEVPSEIWKRPPPGLDPVTHINFFTTDSLRTLMQRAGMDVTTCKYKAFTRPNGMVGIAIKAVGRISNNSQSPEISYFGNQKAKRLLTPSIIHRVFRLMKHPRLFTNFFIKTDLKR